MTSRRRDPIRTLAQVVSLALLFFATATLTAAVRITYAADDLPRSVPNSYWERCSTVEVYLDERDASLAPDVEKAVQYLRDTTGLNITYNGTTRTPDLLAWLNKKRQAIAVTSHLNVFGKRPNILGSTYRYPTSRSQIDSAFVALNLPSMVATGGVYVTILHELGHAIGLEHGGKPGDLMYPNLADFTDTHLTSSEIAVLREHYHCH